MEIFKLFGSIFVDTTDADAKMEKTDNIRYNKDDGKFYASTPNDKTPYKKIKNDVVKISKNKSSSKPKNVFNKLNMEKTIDLYVIDGNEDVLL